MHVARLPGSKAYEGLSNSLLNAARAPWAPSAACRWSCGRRRSAKWRKSDTGSGLLPPHDTSSPRLALPLVIAPLRRPGGIRRGHLFVVSTQAGSPVRLTTRSPPCRRHRVQREKAAVENSLRVRCRPSSIPGVPSPLQSASPVALPAATRRRLA